jgi:hypothetical protein
MKLNLSIELIERLIYNTNTPAYMRVNLLNSLYMVVLMARKRIGQPRNLIAVMNRFSDGSFCGFDFNGGLRVFLKEKI